MVLCMITVFHLRQDELNPPVMRTDSLQERKLQIFIDDPHEAHVTVYKDVGFTMRAAVVMKVGSSLAAVSN
ncbi:hypothetical protein V8C26DRAFT_413256 [Trichoderma gracile]